MKNLIIVALVATLAIVGGLAYAASVRTTADVDVTVWKGVSSGDIYLSTRPAGGSWTTHNTPVDLTTLSSSGRFYQGSAIAVSVPVTVEVPEAAPPSTTSPPSTTTSQQCTGADYDRNEWGTYPRASANAAPTWTKAHDVVNSRTITQDHHVALRDAHISGGCDWSAEMKDRFSSDATNLNPTTASFNSSKGSRTPDQLTGIAARIIDTPTERCDYATQHRDVKRAWGLTMISSESTTVDAWLAGCTSTTSSEASSVEAETETEVAGYWHAHCARNRVSGGCDQRFRPSYYPRHFHPNSVPRHTQGEHEDD